jgi:hypothetical protein
VASGEVGAAAADTVDAEAGAMRRSQSVMPVDRTGGGLPETTGVDLEEVFLIMPIGGFSVLLHWGGLLAHRCPLVGEQVGGRAGREGIHRLGLQLQ